VSLPATPQEDIESELAQIVAAARHAVSLPGETPEAGHQDTASLPTSRVPWQGETDEKPDDTETFGRIDWDGDLATLEAAGPPPWNGMSKADAVRRFEEILPDRAAAQVADLLSSKGVEVDAAYVRKVRSRDRQATNGAATNGTVVPLTRMTV
jgi:hypothetical protein